MTSTILRRSETANGIAYHRAGAGAPVILIHGVGLRAEAWQAQIAPLAKHFELFLIDIPGHGGSVPVGPTVPEIADYTDRIADAIAELTADPAFIAGHSMGAMIALDLATRYPRRWRGVAALNGIFRRSPDARRAVMDRARALATCEGDGIEAPVLRWFGEHPSGANRMAADLCRQWLRDVDRAGYAAAYSAFARHDGPADAALRALDLPALFVTGSEDPNSTPAMSRAMAARAPRGCAEVIEGAAHMAPMTHPGGVNAALLEFFERCSSFTVQEC